MLLHIGVLIRGVLKCRLTCKWPLSLVAFWSWPRISGGLGAGELEDLKTIVIYIIISKAVASVNYRKHSAPYIESYANYVCISCTYYASIICRANGMENASFVRM